MGLSTYELILKIENDSTFLQLLQKGLISLSVLDRKVYYEAFKQELNKVDKKQAIANVSEDYNVSERTIYNAINAMEG